MKKEKLRGLLIVMLCSIIFVLLGVNAALIYRFIAQDKTTKNTMIASNDESVIEDAQITSEPIKGSDVTFLHDTYFSATSEQGNGSMTDYVDDDLAVTYIRTADGDEFEQYQTPTDIYGYAMSVDVEGGTSTGGTAHWSGKTELNATKDALTKLYEERYRDILDGMKYQSTSGRNWIYNYTDDKEESTTIYVDAVSHRVAQIVNPYLTVRFKYSDTPIDPVYSLEDIKSMGSVEEVEDKNAITNMAWVYTVAITKYDEEMLNDMNEQLETIQGFGDILGGSE